MKKAIRLAIFKWRQTDPELFLCAVRWYLRYSLSLRDVEELHSERGLEADHTTIWRGSYWSPFRRAEGGQRRVDQKVVPEGIVPLSRLQHSVDPAEVVEAGAARPEKRHHARQPATGRRNGRAPRERRVGVGALVNNLNACSRLTIFIR